MRVIGSTVFQLCTILHSTYVCRLYVLLFNLTGLSLSKYINESTDTCACMLVSVSFSLMVMALTLAPKAYTADVTISSEFSSTAGFRNVSSAPVTVYNKVGWLP